MVEVKETKAKKPAVKKKMELHEIVGQDRNKAVLTVGIEEDMPILLVGETGTGKTSIIREAAIDRKAKWTRFNLTGETTVDDFVGKYELEKGGTIWRDGILLDALKHGKWLIVDEINVALPEILFVLHSLLDDDKMVTVAQHGGEVVKPHKDFRFFATMNPTDEYAGTKELNKAFQSRFNIVLRVDYTKPGTEARIIADKTGIDMGDATKMVDVAVALRQAKKDEKIFYTCSTRDLIQWGNLANSLTDAGIKDSFGEAFSSAVLNKSNGDGTAIVKIYEHVIGKYLEREADGAIMMIDIIEKEQAQLVRDKADFENDKEKMRQEITQDIIKKLTTSEAKEQVRKATSEEVPVEADDIFSEMPF